VKNEKLIAKIPSFGKMFELWIYKSPRHGWLWEWRGDKPSTKIPLKKASSPTQARTIAELTFKAFGFEIQIVREKTGRKQKIPGLVRVPVDAELASICAENEIPCTSQGFVDFLKRLKK
jgi:hypothetical protein